MYVVEVPGSELLSKSFLDPVDDIPSPESVNYFTDFDPRDPISELQKGFSLSKDGFRLAITCGEMLQVEKALRQIYDLYTNGKLNMHISSVPKHGEGKQEERLRQLCRTIVAAKSIPVLRVDSGTVCLLESDLNTGEELPVS